MKVWHLKMLITLSFSFGVGVAHLVTRRAVWAHSCNFRDISFQEAVTMHLSWCTRGMRMLLSEMCRRHRGSFCQCICPRAMMIMAQNTNLTEMTVLTASWLYHLADLAGSMIRLEAWQDLVLGVLLQNSWICKGTVQEADQRKTCDCQATSQLERTQSCRAGAMESSHSQNKDQHQNGAVPVRPNVELSPSQLAYPDPAQPVGSPCGWCPWCP